MMIKKITAQSFKRYGWIIGPLVEPRGVPSDNLFRIVLRESARVGWRIAYLIVRQRTIERLEQHPASFESFEPVKGKCLLYLSNKKDPSGISCFYLDKPVILRKGLWHGVVTLTSQAEIKITENNSVRCVYWDLPVKLGRNPSETVA
ncbi:MAG TPA: hypothetical protein PKL77_09245 [Candidatus Omnitrophota bacterium]|nr:hypothetical protein [Candidatus Omnitrophota bacterium]HPT06902.1 hypothetical protein [Candidatus Omnitrophota bacterium]